MVLQISETATGNNYCFIKALFRLPVQVAVGMIYQHIMALVKRLKSVIIYV